MELPEEAYWGIVSERNRKAFDVGPLTLDNYPSYIRAIALCKIACARANAEIGALDPEKAKFIEKQLGRLPRENSKETLSSTFTEDPALLPT